MDGWILELKSNMTPKKLTVEEAGRKGGKSKWKKIKDEERLKIMEKVRAARKKKLSTVIP